MEINSLYTALSGIQTTQSLLNTTSRNIVNAQTPGWYNATKILFKALQEAGSLDADKVRDALLKIEGYDAGIYGPVSWGGKSDYGVAHQLLNKFWITEVKDGASRALTLLTPEKK